MTIKVYGADWCSDCIFAKNFFNSLNLKFEYVDITKDNQAKSFVEEVNKGKRIIPTIIIDGVTYVNPSLNELNKIIG
jgi:thioredoxin reductase (NADPH)